MFNKMYTIFAKYMCKLLPGNKKCITYFFKKYPTCYLNEPYMTRLWDAWYNGQEKYLVDVSRPECRNLPINTNGRLSSIPMDYVYLIGILGCLAIYYGITIIIRKAVYTHRRSS